MSIPETSTCSPILLIEDNPLDVDLTLRAFKRCGLANPVLVARDGEEALAWIPRWEAGELLPVVILLDLRACLRFLHYSLQYVDEENKICQ